VTNYKGSMLLEADPSVTYERTVSDFAQEMMGAGRAVAVFTSMGSPIHLLLKDSIQGVRFFLFSESSYPKSNGNASEIMVPGDDFAVILNVLDEVVTRNPTPARAIVFDSVSSLILDAGFQESYKFLRHVNEILSRADVISMFLVLSKAHDEKMMKFVQNLYPGHLLYDATGLHVTRQV
jgi:hypothetical protein